MKTLRKMFAKNIITLQIVILSAVYLVGCSGNDSVTGLFSKTEADTVSQTAGRSQADDESMTKQKSEANPTIVWLGDSLTQGSLGDDNDNLGASPYNIMMALHDVKVEGYGFYGNTANDILWRYCDESQENQTKDPAKVYIFWIGSNDWAVGGKGNTDTEEVIRKLDDFIEMGKIDKYIVMGTTARKELREEYNGEPIYDIINRDLQKHYGTHYMDIESVIGPDDYGPDGVHLTAMAYLNVEEAVYKRLLEDGYVFE